MSPEHIEVDDRGVARIAGSRSRVINIVLDTRNGMTAQEIHEQYPHLSIAQIHAALAYYCDHRQEIDAAIERELEEVAAMRSANPGPSRDKLLTRLGRPSSSDRQSS